MPSPPSPEGQFGSYKLLREVARGELVTTYEARHTHPRFRDRPVALRVSQSLDAAHHFMEAARITARLNHPRIPSAYEAGQAPDDRFYFVRQWVAGSDLRAGLRDSVRTLDEVVRIAADAADALGYAHGLGFIHGSVHPRHLLLGPDGRTWLIGFGEFPPPPELTVFGNPAHLAPEQFENAPLTPACDVYGLAETCFWLLSGRHPFYGLPGLAVLGAKQSGRLEYGLREHRPDFPTGVETVLLRALAPDPRARPASPGEFAKELAAAHQAASPPAGP